MPTRKRKSRAKGRLPKGAYRVPGGGYVTGKRTTVSVGRGRQISVFGVRRRRSTSNV
jgi:hypothetical protein